jgi:hypothetical protein
MKKLNFILESAAHWLDNYDRAEKGKHLLLGPAYCALCLEYIGDDKLTACDDCPVREKTGFSSCYETPYYAAVYAQIDFHERRISEEQFLAAVAAEYTFLINLAIEESEKCK